MIDDDVLDEIRQLIRDAWSVAGPRAEMHLGDLSWALFRRAGADHRNSTRVWHYAAGAPTAAAIYPGPSWCDLVLRPGLAAGGVLDELLDWAEAECWRKNGGDVAAAWLRLGRRIRDPNLQQSLERRGFVPMREGYPALVCDLPDRQPRPPLPPDFSCRELTDAVLGARAAVYNAAFPGESMGADDYACLRGAPDYDSTLDLVVTEVCGAVASFCTLWYDADNRAGLVEPAGCDPRFRRRGLTRFVLLEGLRRLQERGARQAVVRVHHENAVARSLYESCGFRIATCDFGYERHLA